ncbi:MAG TPA: VWA-like domain-containing protein [Acidimicrobiales bacterium]|nr:VWA-like domain-containing protein [Acidimicrobiales bacterium]
MILGPIDRLDPEQRRRWAGARVWAAHQVPYLASALLALEPVVVDQTQDPDTRRLDLSALPVDNEWHVYLDPEVIGALDVATIGFWLVHQVSHLLRHHADRSPAAGTGRTGSPSTERSADLRRWNLAADAEIDDDLVAGDAAHPESAVTPHGLGLPDSLTAEEYWDLLGGSSEGRTGAADCGSGCDGWRRPWDGNGGDGGLDDTGRRLLHRDVARRIREHHRKFGSTPAGWQRWADDILEPSVSWQRLLASAVRRGVTDVAGRVDFSYRKPSRRSSVAGDVILPSLRRPLPKVAMVLDTSGSMHDRLLAQSLAEVAGVLRSLGVGRRHLRIVCCDAQAFEAQRVLKAEDVRLLGGGGTDMGAGLAGASGLRPRPDVIVVLTDGHTPWPATPPRGIRVVVGLMDPTGSVPEWARAVPIGPGPAQ